MFIHTVRNGLDALCTFILPLLHLSGQCSQFQPMLAPPTTATLKLLCLRSIENFPAVIQYSPILVYVLNGSTFPLQHGLSNCNRRTETNAIRFRLSQKIKFQYKKKQHLNQQLYHSHLECAHHYRGMWQHMHMIIDQQLRDIMETKYHTLNKKTRCIV